MRSAIPTASETIGRASDDCLVLVVAEDGRIRDQASGDAGFLRAGVTNLRDTELRDYWPAEIARDVRSQVRKCLRSRGTCRLDVRLEAADEALHHEILIVPHGRASALLICRDMTARRDLEQKVRRLAFNDPLTQLPNRAAFLQRLSAVINDARMRGLRLVVMRIQLEGFKTINQTYGREAGNDIVREAAARLSAALLDDGDTVALPPHATAHLARTSGNEYTLLLTGVNDKATAGELADRLLAKLTTPYSHNENDVSLTGYIGIAEFPQDADDVDTLLTNAGVALSEARGSDSSQKKFFTGTAQVRCLSRMDLADELRWALENDQFSLAFQPCFDARSDTIVSAEALLRWHHPLRGLVPLSEIMPVIETSNLSEDLGEWVLRTACHAALAYPQLDHWKISLNLSSREAYAPLLVERVLQQLANNPLPRGRMQFEIREADFFRDARTVENTARELTRLGFDVILDDCGVGNLSVQSVTRAGIRELKISRTLVSRLPGDETSRRCCAAIIAMGRELGIIVAANGVETREQYDCLRHLGCHFMQGYLFCQPVDLMELADRLIEQQKQLA